MNPFLALLRAALSQDMSLFKIRAKSRFSKFALPGLLTLVVMFAIGNYAYALINALPGFANLALLLALLIITIFTFLEGIYKSGSVLFDSRDNDLLLSLPLSRRQVFAVRVLKLAAFQFLYNLVFLLPVLLVYAVIIRPGISFYLLSPLMLILIPLIPTAFSAIIAYFIRRVSVHFRMPKLVQSVGMIIVFIAFVLIIDFAGQFADQSVLLANAENLQNLFIRAYYPCGIFIQLLQDFQFFKLLLFLLINILPFLLIVWLGSFRYFQIISRSAQVPTRQKSPSKSPKLQKSHPPVFALIQKELSRFFSSAVYMFNTLPSLVLLVILTLALCINAEGLISMADSLEDFSISAAQIFSLLPIFIFLIIILICATVSITSSSVSIEGRTFNFTKSLPLAPAQIFLAKILASLIIICPVVILCALILIFRFQFSILFSIAILLAALIFPFLFGIIGIFFNLKFPKMDAANDTEVVKQSLSPMLSVVVCLIIFVIIAILSINFRQFSVLTMLVIDLTFALLTFLSWRLLLRFGKHRIIEIVA